MSICKYAVALMIACILAVSSAFASEVSYFPGYAQYVFDFGAFPPGRTTPFSETVGNLTISYTAPDDPSAFRTADSAGIPASRSLPWLLGRPGSSILEFTLSRPVFGVAVEYLTLGPGPIRMDLRSGGLGGSIIRTRSDSGDAPSGLIYPEGFISLLPVCVCPNDFDAVRLSDSTDPSFAIRRVYVAENVPEPSTLAFLAVGLAILLVLKFPLCSQLSGTHRTIFRKFP
jgi:hypothetical protein